MKSGLLRMYSGRTDVNNPAGWNGTNLTFPEADTVNQTFPKGMAYAQWLQTVATLVGNPAIYSNGTIQLTDTRDDMIAASPTGCTASTCLSTSWIYDASEANHPRYLSFNTPVGQPVTSQCGRAVYSDVHLSGVSDGSNFPAECNDPNIDSPSGQEKPSSCSSTCRRACRTRGPRHPRRPRRSSRYEVGDARSVSRSLRT